jgi:hypothetical protein
MAVVSINSEVIGASSLSFINLLEKNNASEKLPFFMLDLTAPLSSKTL